jgi:hypothetical protein
MIKIRATIFKCINFHFMTKSINKNLILFAFDRGENNVDYIL